MKYNDLCNYDKGIFWGIGSFTDGRIVFRHKDPYFIERMKLYTDNRIYQQESKDKEQNVLKTSDFDCLSFTENGWTARNANERNVPLLVNYKDFIRSYVELHSSLEYSRRYKDHNKTKRYKALKLIIYGNYIMMESFNKILHEEVGVNRKTVRIVSKNNKTASLNFTSLDEIQCIYNYLYDYPNSERFWDMVNLKLQNPLIFD